MANRESLSTQPVRLTWSEESSRLEVLTPSDDPDEPMRPDRLIPGVSLDLLSIREARAGATEFDDEQWSFETAPGSPRPLLTMTLEGASRRAWTVALEPQSTTARLSIGDDPPNRMQSIDLDEKGMRDQAW
jgi:hypothetical protein